MHLSELPSGRWRVAVRVNGTRRTASAPTRAEARLLGAQLEVELGARRHQDTSAVTVGDLLDAHLAAVDWSPTTLADAIHVADRLPPVFRNRPVHTVDAATIAALYRELIRTGWSPHRTQRVRMVLSTAWGTAIEYRWANHNPARDARTPKLPHRRITPPDEATVLRLLEAAREPFGTFLRLAALSGARRGELLAMQWGDVDLSAGRWTITRSLVWTTAGYAERDTKTAVKGHRTLGVGPGIAARLQAVRDARTESHGPWVFSRDNGMTPWRGDYASREFARLCKRVGVTGVRLHDIRHHLATSLLAEGEPVHRVSSRLGHASTATTQRVYAHWITDDDELAARLDGRYG